MGCPECTEQKIQTLINEIQDRFDVVIDNSGGLWTLDHLNAIDKGMQKLQNAMGKDDFALQFSGVKFMATNNGKNYMYTYGKKDIWVPMSGRNGYVEKNTVHELAHIWDNNCNDCMSTEMMIATKSEEKRAQKYLGGLITIGNDVYLPKGITPSNHATINKGEDWAESVTYYLYPNGSNSGWINDIRHEYVGAIFDKKGLLK